MIILNWILGFLLLLFSVIDIKFKQIPSIFLTGTLFVILALNPANLYFGVMAFVFAWLLYDFDFIGGAADIKIIVMIGLMISSFFNLSVFVLLVLIYGVVWKGLVKYLLKKEKEYAFVPALFFVYVVMCILGMI